MSPAGTGDTDESCNALDLDPRRYLLLLFSRYVMSNSFVTPWTVACHGVLCPQDFPSRNTKTDCYLLLQEVFPTQGSNPHLLHWQEDSLP